MTPAEVELLQEMLGDAQEYREHDGYCHDCHRREIQREEERKCEDHRNDADLAARYARLVERIIQTNTTQQGATP